MTHGSFTKYADGDDLASEARNYFEWAKENNEPLTVTGMCNYLDITLDTFLRYEENPLFSEGAKKAKQHVMASYERNLHGGTPTGSIFALKAIKKDYWNVERVVDTRSSDGSMSPRLTPEETEILARAGVKVREDAAD